MTHKNPNKKKKCKYVKAKKNKTGPDEKETKLEGVEQTALSFPTTSVELNYHNFVKIMTNCFKYCFTKVLVYMTNCLNLNT